MAWFNFDCLRNFGLDRSESVRIFRSFRGLNWIYGDRFGHYGFGLPAASRRVELLCPRVQVLAGVTSLQTTFFENGTSPKFCFVPEFCALHFLLTMSASPHEDISMSPILVAMCENGEVIPFGLIF